MAQIPRLQEGGNVTDPQSSNSRGREMQPDDAAEGNFAFITDGRLHDGYAGRYDIDGGDTTIISPEIDLSNASQINLSFSYFFAHLTNTNNDDYLRVTVIGENEPWSLSKNVVIAVL